MTGRHEAGVTKDRRVRFAGAAVLTVAATALFVFAPSRKTASETADPIAGIVSRLPYRPAEGRVSGNYPYRPWKERTRGAEDDARATAMSLLAAAAELETASPGAARAAAAWLFGGNSERALARAASALPPMTGEETLGARIERAGDWRSLNDVAAAAHAVAGNGRRGDVVLVAVAAAARAHELAPRAPEPLWNQALTLEAIGLVEEARAAWRDYLALDASSEWSTEAAERLRALDAIAPAAGWNPAAIREAASKGDTAAVAALAARFPLHVKTVAEQEWIPRWAAAAAAKESSAATRLAAIESAARAIGGAARDEQLGDFLAALRSAPDPLRFARAHIALGEVRGTLDARGTAAGIELLQKVAGDLRDVRSPLAATAVVDLSGHLYHAGRHAEALRELDALGESLDRARWPLLSARGWWNRGVALTSVGDFGSAGAAYRHALETYEQTGDLTHAGMLRMLIGHNAETAGDPDTAWRFYIRGLREAMLRGDAERVPVILDTFSRAALRNGYPGAASVLNDALISRLGQGGSPAYLTHALITRCEIEGRSGDPETASAQCARARQVWSSIADRAVRERLEADLELAAAMAAPPPERLELLARAVQVTTARNDVYRLPRVLALHGETCETLAQPRLAQEDYERALDFIDAQRSKLESVADKLTYFETSERIAASLVRLLVRTGKSQEALAVVERVRARALLERIARTSAIAPMPAESLRTRLEPGRGVVEYWSDRDHLYAWLITGDGVTFIRQPVTRRTLQSLARQFVSAIESGAAGEMRAASEALHGQLIAPLGDAIAKLDVLTIVPDGAIADVPFAALRDAATGRYLVEQIATTRASSASAFVAAREIPPRHDSILIVANPETATAAPLLDVEGEIAAARRAARRTLLLSGRDASAAALGTAARDFDIVHIAAHALESSDAGEPAVMLSPERAGDDGMLTASEVESTVALRKGALVVVAACSTARGRTLSEGTMSIARSFLAAGAGSAIASLWDAGDADSSRIFTAFYAALARGATPAAALRDAQLSLLRSNAHVRISGWAAYQIHGGA